LLTSISLCDLFQSTPSSKLHTRCKSGSYQKHQPLPCDKAQVTCFSAEQLGVCHTLLLCRAGAQLGLTLADVIGGACALQDDSFPPQDCTWLHTLVRVFSTWWVLMG
jgi:hypothetical protein